MKNKKILVIIFVILLVVCLIILAVKPFKGKEEVVDHYKGFTTYDGEKYELCNDKTRCKYPFVINYQTISYKTRDKNIKKIVEAYNEEMKGLYDKTISSKLKSNSDCGDFTGVYNYRYASQVIVDQYVDDKYFIIANERTDFDLCLDKVTPVKPNPIIYDLKKKETITQEEFISRLKIDDSIIKKSIDEYIEDRDIENPIVDYNDVSVFYNGEYGLVVSFLIEGYTGYTTTSVLIDN